MSVSTDRSLHIAAHFFMLSVVIGIEIVFAVQNAMLDKRETSLHARTLNTSSYHKTHSNAIIQKYDIQGAQCHENTSRPIDSHIDKIDKIMKSRMSSPVHFFPEQE